LFLELGNPLNIGNFTTPLVKILCAGKEGQI